MDEHMLIEFLVNRIQGCNRLADDADRGDTLEDSVRSAQWTAGAAAYLDVLQQLATFECEHLYGCRCAAGG